MPRAKGQGNSAKLAFRERLKRYCKTKRVDPHYYLAACIADTSTQVVGVTEDGEPILAPTVSVALKIQCAKELAQYLEPKLRSVELTGDADNPVRVLQELPQDQLDARIAHLLAQTGFLTKALPLVADVVEAPTLSPTGEVSL